MGGPPSRTGPFRRAVTVVNPLGLHFRVADRFSRTAKQYPCAVTVWNGDTRADGKSPMELLLLVALPGAELTLETAGPDAEKAIDPLADILAAPGGEDYSI
jgi:phosphotransferase system HPr (HPr) family protein